MLADDFDEEDSQDHVRRCEQHSLHLSQLDQTLTEIKTMPSRLDKKQFTQVHQQIEDMRNQVSQAKELAYA